MDDATRTFFVLDRHASLDDPLANGSMLEIVFLVDKIRN